MENIANRQEILIFIAKLAWADGILQADEISHLLKLRKASKLPPSTDSYILSALAYKYSHDEIASEYQRVLGRIGGGEAAKDVLAKEIFDILAADDIVGKDEIDIIKQLRSLDADPEAAKVLVFFSCSPPTEPTREMLN